MLLVSRMPNGFYIPRRLWAYWEGATIPEMAAACLATLRRTNPTWNLTIMSPDNVAALGLDPPPGSPAGIADPSRLQHIADWYRVEALARYGGVYMDASNVNLLPLETWVNVSSAAVQGYQRPMETRYPSEGAMSEGVLSEMENWAIAAPVDSRFMARWRDHFAEALAEGLDAYVARQDNITMGQLKVADGYLAQHVGWVLTRNELSEEEAPTHLISSTDEGRPFHFMIEHGWVSAWVAFYTMQTPRAAFGNKTAFLKFRSAERSCVSPLWTYSAFWFWPFADSGSPSLAASLRADLEAEPELLRRATSAMDAKAVCFFLLQWWLPLLLLLMLLVALCWGGCYCFCAPCRQCTDRRAYCRKSLCCTPHSEEETLGLTDEKTVSSKDELSREQSGQASERMSERRVLPPGAYDTQIPHPAGLRSHRL